MEEYVETLSESKVWGMDLLMILVSLGTQDRSFKRLLEAIEKQIELGNIKERVVVQAGETIFESEHMEIFDLIPSKDFLKLLDECDLLICHGGVGTIIDGLKHHKKILAAARLQKYAEHQNDHQKQIIHEFVSQGLILELDDFDKLDEKLKDIQNFEPKEYKSHTKEFIKVLDEYILESTQNHQGNLYRKFMQYAFYGVFSFFIEIAVCFLFQKSNLNGMQFFGILAFYVFLYRIMMHHLFFKTVSYNIKGEIFFYLLLLLPCFFSLFFSSSYPSFSLVFLIFAVRFFLVYLFNVLWKVQDVELY